MSPQLTGKAEFLHSPDTSEVGILSSFCHRKDQVSLEQTAWIFLTINGNKTFQKSAFTDLRQGLNLSRGLSHSKSQTSFNVGQDKEKNKQCFFETVPLKNLHHEK